MNFNERLKELRKNKGLTQEELASKLYVSRTTISKWESGNGYPSIDILKSLANFFEISIDELISNNEVLDLSKENIIKEKKKNINLVIGLLEICSLLFLILPIFSNKNGDFIESVILFKTNYNLIYYILYYLLIGLSFINGVVMLILINKENNNKLKLIITLSINILLVLVFILTKRPYPGCLAFILLLIKSIIFFKK